MEDREAFFQYAFGMRTSDMPGDVVMSPFFSARNFMKECKEKKIFHGRFFSVEVASKNGRRIAFLKLGKATYLSGDAILSLGTSAAKRLIFVNSCASLDGSAVGSVFIPERTLNGESFSDHHCPEHSPKVLLKDKRWVYADSSLYDHLSAYAREKISGRDVKQVNNFTIGSIFAETVELREVLRKKGIDSIDMELSKVLTAAEISGIKASSIMVVSDDFRKRSFFREFTKAEKGFYNDSCAKVSRFVVDFLSDNGGGGIYG